MPEGEKPYRLYRGGRRRGKVPAPPGPKRERKPKSEGGARYPGPGPAPKATRKRRRFRWGRWLALLVALFAAWVIVWCTAGYLSFESGVSSANKRLDREARAVLTKQGGWLTGKATNILLLGTDHADTSARSGDRHSDSIMLVRSDGKHHRIAYLSIPRDLWVDVPGHGRMKVNAAFQIGGPALATRTVAQLTGLPINHLVVVDFGEFRSLIDAIGGVTVKLAKPILSNRFDCPFSAEGCAGWKGWRFEQGTQHLDGRRALVYSRIRENQLDPSESDFTRAERQQQVLQAVAGKLASFDTFLRLPFDGGDLLRPLATDLGPGQFLQLGWVKFRTSGGRTLHCRLGGEGTHVGGESVILPDELNRNVIAMVTGDSAPQPPPPGSGPYGPGCVTGSQTLGSR